MKTIYLCFLTIFSIQLLFSQDIELDLIASGFNNPVGITHAQDERLFIVEQGGTIKIIEADGSVLSTPFLDITSQILNGGERGLLGLTFHPDYNLNGFLFVNYTNNSGDTVVSRFSVSDSDANLVDMSSESIILSIDQPYSNHNGGDLAFGPDGYLYIPTGDGGSGGDPDDRAQNPNELLGKVLRLNVDNGMPYSIPPNNPFVGTESGLDEIWAIGLRNPWRFSFDSETGDLWIADVGQNNTEEINMVPSSNAGINYGWRCYEGSSEYNTSGDCPTDTNDITFPIAEYSHTQNGAFKCSITGGYRHRGSEQPNLNGWYFFADYCSDEIGILTETNDNWTMVFTEAFSGNGWSSFGEDINGEIYIAGKESGDIYKIMDPTLSVSTSSIENIKVFPNPVTNSFKVTSENTSKKISAITLLNLHGNTVLETQVSNKQFIEISTEELSAGFYLAEVIFNDGSKVIKKLIKNE